LRLLALRRAAFLAPAGLVLAAPRLTFPALTRRTFLALARLGLAPRQVRPQRRREPLLVAFGAPMGHGMNLGEEAGRAQALR
jgi:hypothetical protein